MTDGGQNGFKRSKQVRVQEAGGVARAGMSFVDNIDTCYLTEMASIINTTADDYPLSHTTSNLPCRDYPFHFLFRKLDSISFITG